MDAEDVESVDDDDVEGDDGDCDCDNDILRSAESIGGFHKSMSLISFSKIARKKGFAKFQSLSSLTL